VNVQSQPAAEPMFAPPTPTVESIPPAPPVPSVETKPAGKVRPASFNDVLNQATSATPIEAGAPRELAVPAVESALPLSVQQTLPEGVKSKKAVLKAAAPRN
jgi:hypothetical protein